MKPNVFEEPIRRALAAAVLLAAWPLPAAEEPVVEPGALATYRLSLERLATGDDRGALDHLIATEIEVLATADDGLAILERRHSTMARRLAERPEALVPLVLLHEAAYRRHLDEDRLDLAIYSRRHAAELVDHYINLSRRPDKGETASQLLTSLGGYLQQASMASVAITLYERALDLDAENHAARLSLAGLYERQGSYELALPYLEELVRRHPGHREARLRLGINLERLGRRAEGEAALESILVADEADWILSLAYQELARLAVSDGDPRLGIRLLREARERLPDDPSLDVQVAYLADRIGFRSSPDELALALQRNARSERPSPRSLYSRVSGEALEGLRSTLAVTAERRLAELAESLARFRSSGRAAP